MGLDIEKVAMLTGMVDKLIQMKHVDNALDESVVEELIQKALFISDVPYSDDEIAAVKRDIAYKYQIQARPGQAFWQIMSKPTGMTTEKLKFSRISGHDTRII